MLRPRQNSGFLGLDDTHIGARQRKVVPHEFVLDAIAPLSPQTRPMFGCLAVYIEDKIVLILRDKQNNPADNGVWLATTKDHHQSLRRELPNMRSVRVFKKEVTDWQVLPTDAPDFEEAALHACELIIARDPRIGKTPGTRRVFKSEGKKAKKAGKPLKRVNFGKSTGKDVGGRDQRRPGRANR